MFLAPRTGAAEGIATGRAVEKADPEKWLEVILGNERAALARGGSWCPMLAT